MGGTGTPLIEELRLAVRAMRVGPNDARAFVAAVATTPLLRGSRDEDARLANGTERAGKATTPYDQVAGLPRSGVVQPSAAPRVVHRRGLWETTPRRSLSPAGAPSLAELFPARPMEAGPAAISCRTGRRVLR